MQRCRSLIELPADLAQLSVRERVSGGIDVPRGVLGRVDVAVEAGWVVLGSQVGVLGEKSSEFGIEVAGFGVVEAGLGVEDVAGEGEAVGAVGELSWEAEVAPGV